MRTSASIGAVAVAGILTLLSTGCVIHTGGCSVNDNCRAKFSRQEDMTAPTAGIAALDVSVEVGKIQLDAADVTEFRIGAAITVRASSEEKAQELAEGVRLTVEPSGHTLTIRAIKPAGFGHSQLNVDLTITAPAGLDLTCNTNVGDIHVTGFTQRVNARTNVGTIACTDARGVLDLNANVGDVRATYAGDAPAVLRAELATDVGNIEFAGPTEISADLRASCNVGSIHTDRPLTVSGSMKHSVNATLGQGEGQVTLRTNVGSIRIR